MKIKKDDYVQVISGEDRGRRGRVLRVLTDEQQAIVEGVNYIYRHVRKGPKTPQSGRVQKEAAIDLCKLKLYCPHCQAPTRIFYAYEEEKAAQEKKADSETVEKKIKVRCCKKCKRRV